MSRSVFVFGISGRMGQEVVKEVERRPKEFRLMGGASRSSTQPAAQTPDLVIDFSLPENLPNLEKFVRENPCPVVSGTTGFDDMGMQRLRGLGQIAPIFWSANMSFGVFILCQMAEALARYHRFYQLQIEETHHIHKKDKPSGTALMIESAVRRSSPTLLPTISHRQGEVFGLHRLQARSGKEVIEIRHEALDRGLFAQGAVDVGLWLVKQPPGFYTMADFFADLPASRPRE